MENPFSWSYLRGAPGDGPLFDPLMIAILVVFAVGFIASAYASARPKMAIFKRRVHRRNVMRSTAVLMWVCGIGLFFGLIRLLQINPASFGERIWIYLTFLVLLVVIATFAVLYFNASKARLAAPVGTITRGQKSTYAEPSDRRPTRRRRVTKRDSMRY